jgi:hypothetical protein
MSNETLQQFVDNVHRIDRLYCSTPPSDLLRDVKSVTLTDTDIVITTQEAISGHTLSLTAPLSSPHRMWRHKFEICDRFGEAIFILESAEVDFYKLILNQKDINK